MRRVPPPCLFVSAEAEAAGHEEDMVGGVRGEY